jgi:hypothetical protein
MIYFEVTDTQNIKTCSEKIRFHDFLLQNKIVHGHHLAQKN